MSAHHSLREGTGKTAVRLHSEALHQVAKEVGGLVAEPEVEMEMKVRVEGGCWLLVVACNCTA